MVSLVVLQELMAAWNAGWFCVPTINRTLLALSVGAFDRTMPEGLADITRVIKSCRLVPTVTSPTPNNSASFPVAAENPPIATKVLFEIVLQVVARASPTAP